MIESNELSYAGLGTQTQLCERLAHLTRFSSLLVFISGEPGSGKSTIAQQYLESQPDNNQALIICLQASTAQTIRQQIISQLYPSASFEPQEPLIDSFYANLTAASQNLLIVIDDAHLLPKELLDELWELQLDNRSAGYPNQINILLFAPPKWCNQSIARLKAQSDEPPIELDIPLLTSQDVASLAQYLLRRAELSTSFPDELNASISRGEVTPGHVGHILFPDDAAEKKAFNLTFPKRVPKVNVKVLAISALVVLMVIISGLYQIKGNKVVKPEPIALKLPELQSEINVSEPEEKPSSPELLVSDWPEATGKQNDAELPELVNNKPLQLDSKAVVGKRVLVSDARVNQLLEQELKSTTLVKPAENSAQKFEKQSVPLSDKTPKLQEQQIKKVTEQAAKPRKKKYWDLQTRLKQSEEQLNKKSGTRYTIQLAGLSEPQKVAEFIVRHQLYNSAWVYKSSHKGNAWFVIVTGDFSNLEESREAIAKLPKSLLSLSPWSKSFSAVHKEQQLVTGNK